MTSGHLKLTALCVTAVTIPLLALAFLIWNSATGTPVDAGWWFVVGVATAGAIAGTSVVWWRRTLREQSRTDHARRNARFGAVLDAMAEAVLIYDEVGVRYVNQAGAELHGVTPGELMAIRRAHNFVEYLDTNGDRAVYAELPTLKTFATGQPHSNEVIGLRRLSDDRVFWVIASAAPLSGDIVGDPVGRQVIVTYTDITERRRLEAQLAAARRSAEKLAKYDGLTGLPNRNHTVDFLIDGFERAQASGERVALFFVDLDHFKDVNDSGGHLAGDELLRQASDRFRRTIRTGDLVGRFGGDEFAFVLGSVGSAEGAAEVAERVLHALKAPFEVEGRLLHVSASIGIALSQTEGSSVFELLREADAAMYLAKELGRNGYQFFTHELSASSERRLTLLHRVREALDEDGLELHYQPVVDRDRETMAVEALLRCNDAELGPIPPLELIAAARVAGLVPELGWWVLRTAVAQIATWRAEGHPIQMAVNVDPEQLRDPRFTERVAALLDRHGVPPSALEIEVTEEGLVDDAVGAETLRSLHQLGVGIAIDDFGTGYSALTYLMKLPITSVKLDRAFIEQVAAGTANRAVARHVIELAHALDLRVVAEGVEDEATLAFLLESGCDAFQGYLFARPAPAAEVAAHLPLVRAA